MRRVDKGPVVVDFTVQVGILQDHAEHGRISLECGSVADDEFDAEWLGTGFQNVDGLRQTRLGNK